MSNEESIGYKKFENYKGLLKIISCNRKSLLQPRVENGFTVRIALKVQHIARLFNETNLYVHKFLGLYGYILANLLLFKKI